MFYLNVCKMLGVILFILINLNYCNNCGDKMNILEVYECFIYDCMFGDVMNFIYWDEVVFFWKFVDIILEVWESIKV